MVFSYRLFSTGRTRDIPEIVCSFGNGTQNQWAPNMPLCNMINFKLLLKTKYTVK